MKIFEDERSHFDAFIRLNERWIEDCFELEEADEALRDNPELITEAGGHVFTAFDGETVVGGCALFKSGVDEFELARMAVDPGSQRRGIGKRLADCALERARAEGAVRVFLLTNTALKPAVRLYERLGFHVVSEGSHPDYVRVNLVMERRF